VVVAVGINIGAAQGPCDGRIWDHHDRACSLALPDQANLGFHRRYRPLPLIFRTANWAIISPSSLLFRRTYLASCPASDFSSPPLHPSIPFVACCSLDRYSCLLSRGPSASSVTGNLCSSPVPFGPVYPPRVTPFPSACPAPHPPRHPRLFRESLCSSIRGAIFVTWVLLLSETI